MENPKNDTDSNNFTLDYIENCQVSFVEESNFNRKIERKRFSESILDNLISAKKLFLRL